MLFITTFTGSIGRGVLIYSIYKEYLGITMGVLNFVGYYTDYIYPVHLRTFLQKVLASF